MSVDLSALKHQIAQRPGIADQMWSWTHTTQLVATKALHAAASDSPYGLDWIEAQMAWAVEDLDDAGGQPIDFQPRIPESDDDLQLVTALLSHVASLEVVDIDDRCLAQACQDAVLRAQLCLLALSDRSQAEPLRGIAA
ncbi:MAG: hypothetical protein Q8N51_02300 [Gammaproteobacteria bacterium]|nr:hypothetical protein [Gammaproteobacteria bacterium]